MKNNYRYGRKKEKLVAQQLEKFGAQVILSLGSRGPADITAKFSNKKWKIQVKSTRGGNPNLPSKEELRRLKISAAKSKAVPVIAYVEGNKVIYQSVKTGRELKP